MTAEQQIRRNEQNELDGHVRDCETGGKQACADKHFRERMTLFFVLLLLLGCDDLRLALDARADLSDLWQQCIRVFAGHTQLLGLKDKHAVLNAVQFADALLHLRRAVCTADILKRINALDAVAPCGVLVMMVMMLVLVVVTAAAVIVIIVVVVMMFVLVVVTAAAVVVIVMVMMMLVLMLVTAAAVIIIIVVMVVMMLVLVVVAAAAVVIIVVVVMMLVLMVVTAAAVVIIVVMVMMMLVLMVVTAAAVVVIIVMVVMMLVLVVVRFFYFLCVRSGFFLLLFCHCCRLLIRNNI